MLHFYCLAFRRSSSIQAIYQDWKILVLDDFQRETVDSKKFYVETFHNTNYLSLVFIFIISKDMEENS